MENSEKTGNSGKEYGCRPVLVRKLSIPEVGLVALVGASGCGKSTFAAEHFKPTEVLSSDTCRAWVSDDELDQSATTDAFDVLHYIAAKRLDRGKLVVVDATNVQPEARRALVRLAKSQHVLATAIIFSVNERICQERNLQRSDRQVPPHVITRQCQALRQSIRGIEHEGFRYSFTLGPAEMTNATIERTRLWTDRRDDVGPFDIIGDVHGCADELRELLSKLGYATDSDGHYAHPANRRAFFIGDLVDRGPDVVGAVDIARAMVGAGSALAVPGNHDEKFLRRLRGKKVSITHGLQDTVDQIAAIPDDRRDEWKSAVAKFLDGLISHYVLDDGKLVVAHAGLAQKMQGRASGAVREFCLYGDVTGEVDEDGLPVRRDWSAEYRGVAAVVYGHTPVAEPKWINNTINIDTGCVFGGALTALRWPERELVSVVARRAYSEPSRPFLNLPTALVDRQSASPFDLFLGDVISTESFASQESPTSQATAAGGASGNRRIVTRLAGNVLIARENAAAALEVISRYAVDPRWLVYLPPTMSPCETEGDGPFLEHPNGAFGYYRRNGVAQVICEEKHMGSRAIIVICRDPDVANKRFGVPGDDAVGECYTRTGRRFFSEPARSEFLLRVRAALGASGFWDRFESNWALIDAEILPWNAKAQGLIQEQYAPVGAAAKAALSDVHRAVLVANARGMNIDASDLAEREDAIARYIEAYRAYCWPVDGLNGIEVAPFHLLATENAVHADKNHAWHLDALHPLSKADPELFRATDHLPVDLADESAVEEAVNWWLSKTEARAEGMVVKPLEFVVRSDRGLVQPAIKCRGREYLRIIYGPEYTLPRNIEGLRSRGLNRKRSLAVREFALGIEGIERFVAGAPLHSVHECAFGVLALESEPVDPRL
jgi:protein phosphatase